MHYRTTSDAARRGAIAVWVALSASVIIGILALNLDGGRTVDDRRYLQSVADSAALAAAKSLYQQYWDSRGFDPADIAKKAAQDAAVANGLPASSISVSIPPTTGAYAGQAGYVEIRVQATQRLSFASVFNAKPLAIQARSVACGQPMKIGLIAMNPTQSGALTNRALAFSVINNPVIVNSNSASAFRQESFGVVLASRFDITGNYTNSGGAIFLLNRIRTGTTPVLDPLAYLPVPSTAGLSVEGSSPTTISSLLPTILRPGIYRGGLRITGLSIVVMLPGMYIMDGGGFQVEGLATVAGLGVTIYNTQGSYAAGPIAVTTLGKVVLVAPLAGTYQGINFFQNRALTNPITVTGIGLTTITGVVYARQAHASLTGSAAAGLDILGGAYVVDTMELSGIGMAQINLNFNPPRVPDIHLVE